MADDLQVHEFHGVDVETAVEEGLAQLGVDRAAVTVEVLDRGSRGLLGLGGREARVRLTVAGSAAPAQPAPTPPVAAPPAPTPPPAATPTPRPVPPPERPAPATAEPPSEGAQAQAVETGRALLTELLARMEMPGRITVRYSDPDDRTGQRVPILNIEDSDSSALIGQRGETLNALQFVTRLMVGHQTHERTNLIIDVDGYRARREASLMRLAERMAGKVVKRGRAVTLEPMPPHERRIIHLALRDHDAVTTQSSGEGNRRKVRIFPKK